MGARVSRRSDARAAAVRQLTFGYFHPAGSTGAWVNCPEGGCPTKVTVALNYGVRTPAQITGQLRDALTDHLLDAHPG